MQYLLLGFAALIILLLLTRVYTVADPRALARRLRIVVGAVLLAAAAVLVLRGFGGLAMSLGAVGLWLISGIGGGAWDGADAQAGAGNTSRIATDHLEVELDHDTGQIRGRVIQGAFAGRELESLAPSEIAQLWQDCRFADPQSAQILEAYLDRTHPTWREDMARTEGRATGPDGRMTRQQALDILSLSEGATEAEIRRAHRDLMLKLHPDRGGSTFLAAQINEAKTVLLGG